jgi:hypothetical protein
MLAEQLVRYGAYVADVTWRDRALRAFDQFGDREWTATTVWQNLFVRAVAADSAGMVRAGDRMASLSLEGSLADLLSWLAAVTLHDLPMLDTLRERTENWSSRIRWAEHLGLYSAYLAAPLDDWKLAVDAVASQQVTTTDRVRTLSQRFAIAVLEDDIVAATTRMSQLLAVSGTSDVDRLAGPVLLHVAGDTAYADLAEQVALALEGEDSYAARCYAGIHAAATGGATADLANRVRALAQQEPQYRGLCALVMAAVVGGDETALRDLAALMREGPREPAWQLANLILAQQWLAQGDSARALNAVRRRAVHPDWMLLLPMYRRLEEQLRSETPE